MSATSAPAGAEIMTDFSQKLLLNVALKNLRAWVGTSNLEKYAKAIQVNLSVPPDMKLFLGHLGRCENGSMIINLLATAGSYLKVTTPRDGPSFLTAIKHVFPSSSLRQDMFGETFFYVPNELNGGCLK